MNNARVNTWQDIQMRIRSNIMSRRWSPGDLIPGEVALAKEYGCSRTTVNRALRELASTGVIDRKRKSGTRVAVLPVRHVRAKIPVIRQQVESRNQTYSFKLIHKQLRRPEKQIQELLQISKRSKALHVQSVHFADGQSFIYEDRWINPRILPDIKNVDLAKISANEWLVQHVPITNGEVVVEANNANRFIAKALEIEVGKAILTSRRTTWTDDHPVTTVQMSFVPGYQMQFEI